MNTFTEYLSKIENLEHRKKLEEILNWVSCKFPSLLSRIAWNQPMFTDHDTFIMGFSVSKNHIAISPEKAGMIHFKDEIAQSGYVQSKMLFRISWDSAVDYILLERMIAFNIADKADCKTFWR